MRQCFCIFVSQVCLCLMRNFSPPTHPSFILLYLHPFHIHTHTHRWSRPVEDLPSEEAAGVSAQMFLSAKGAPSLEHQRGEIVTHSRGKYLRQRDEPLAGDSSLANVTPRNEEVAKKKKKNNRIADILFMTLKLWHQEIKGISPSPQKKLRVALHSIWGILLCTPKNSEFRLRNWLQGLQKYRASRLWNKKWGYRLNVSSADCYSPQKALGQLDKYYYLNLPLLLWKHGRLLILWHIPADWRFFCLTFSDISFTAHLVILSSQPKLEKSKKRLWGKSSKVATTQSEDLSVKAS